MKNIALIFVAAFIVMLSSCAKETSGKVKIRFTNKSAYNLNDIKVQDRNVGNLSTGEESKYIHFDHFAFDSSWPAEDITIYKEGMPITQRYLSFCSTSYNVVERGAYEVDINLWFNTDGSPYITMR